MYGWYGQAAMYSLEALLKLFADVRPSLFCAPLPTARCMNFVNIPARIASSATMTALLTVLMVDMLCL